MIYVLNYVLNSVKNISTHISDVLYSGARILVPPFSLWQNSSSI